MTMGLAVIMIVLIGVMGAGLLTFVSKDLNTMTEENRGQRAFDLADAGVGAAKRQLFFDCGSNTDCYQHYNGGTDAADYQWSADPSKGGLTLNDLDGDGVGGTPDNVNVAISFTGTTTTPYDFKVVSTGNYGDAKRKIETTFRGIGGGGGGGAATNPGYYTPSDIMIEGRVALTGLSLFSEKNIIIRDLATKTRAGFSADFQDNAGALKIADSPDPLQDWYSPDLTPPNNWNLTKRTNANGTQPYKKLGFAAEGKICSSTTTCTTSNESVADGVYGYDSTTESIGTNKRFYVKDAACSSAGVCPTPSSSQPSNKITYPFPRLKPDASRLKTLASNNTGGNKYWACPSPAPSSCSPPWDTLFPNSADADKVVFVDAKSNNLQLDLGNSGVKGILVIWCGNFVLKSPFQGIVINLYGDGSSFGASTCDNSKGVFALETDSNETVKTWVYANGGTGTATTAGTAGIVLRDGSNLQALPGGGDLASIAFGSASSPPTSFELQGWRELYR
ncbi:MAG: hypothetical protein M3P49_03955 [Actinomycetota bacterium]|nr:hypothetical protein [Actinomycetota bacterium]